MELEVSFKSDGLTLAGVLHVPPRLSPGEKRPAIIVLHGFGANKDGINHRNEAEMYCDLGYFALRFDMRGCGASEGPRGRILCLDQVDDTRNAIDWLQTFSGIDAERIAVYRWRGSARFGGDIVWRLGGRRKKVHAAA
jgi:uncharacterized protein